MRSELIRVVYPKEDRIIQRHELKPIIRKILPRGAGEDITPPIRREFRTKVYPENPILQRYQLFITPEQETRLLGEKVRDIEASKALTKIEEALRVPPVPRVLPLVPRVPPPALPMRSPSRAPPPVPMPTPRRRPPPVPVRTPSRPPPRIPIISPPAFKIPSSKIPLERQYQSFIENLSLSLQGRIDTIKDFARRRRRFTDRQLDSFIAPLLIVHNRYLRQLNDELSRGVKFNTTERIRESKGIFDTITSDIVDKISEITQ